MHACSERDKGAGLMPKRQKVMAVDDGIVDSFIEIDRISVGNFEEATLVWGIEMTVSNRD
jgi:hypothetical protein